MGIFYPFHPQPINEMWEVVGNFFSDENTVDHMTAEQPHFDLVPQMQIYLLVFVDAFEDIRSGGSIGEFELVEAFFHNL